MKSCRSISWSTAIVLALLLAGCALPDLRPFAHSTADLYSATRRINETVTNTLESAGAPDAVRSQFSDAMDARVNAMAAMVEYADALAAVADAGEKGSESAQGVAGALNTMLGTLGGGPIPANVVSVAAGLYGMVANVRAAQSFGEAVHAADPAIQGIARVMVNDMSDMEDILVTARQAIVARIESEPDNDQVIDYRNQLDRRRRQLEQDMATAMQNPAANRVRIDALGTDLAAVNELVDQTRDRIEPIQSELRTEKRRLNAGIALIDQMRDGIAEWAAIHAGLVNDVNAGLAPGTAQLAAIIEDMKELIREVKTL